MNAKTISISLLLCALTMIQYANGLYFYVAHKEIKCFKDELLRNSEIQAHVTVVDNEIKTYMKNNPTEGIYFTLEDPENKVVLTKLAKSDELITHKSNISGEFKLCLLITEQTYLKHDVKQVKVILKYSNEYYKLNTSNADYIQVSKKEIEKQIQYQSAATQGQFMPITRRVDKIDKVIDDIIAHQDYEREREQEYKQKLESLSGSFFNLISVQIILVIGVAAYSVINLRKFFVKKHIF
ncbi:transmembrane emp24 domain-containing protein eca-like [Stylonychia lemnae]|uniref:Transmembrane emp24 domain-containing protein eca-like n=1 Tax=Stylonychia lemnae TaxID=5949 RepID=A0A078BAE3_STYLE|nr:transmembrane emp24 domain-containing protein eca-like [Stylonychia lemnae]|eukprot:CDW90498.1 transmembrane emp24 domain-containing protein eca-like [Stylonychia lemnae]